MAKESKVYEIYPTRGRTEVPMACLNCRYFEDLPDDIQASPPMLPTRQIDLDALAELKIDPDNHPIPYLDTKKCRMVTQRVKIVHSLDPCWTYRNPNEKAFEPSALAILVYSGKYEDLSDYFDQLLDDNLFPSDDQDEQDDPE